MTNQTPISVPRLRRIDDPDFSQSEHQHLTATGLDLWRVDLAKTSPAEPRFRALLSPNELQRADRFHFDRDRTHYCAARGLLRIVLSAYLNTSPQAIQFRYLDKGKPEVATPDVGSTFAFNVSHSGGVALFGVTRGRIIGVDVEKIRTDFDTQAIARRFFSAQEQQQLATLPEEHRPRAFFHYWTLKEAFIKALGEGLSHPLHQFDVTLGTPSALTTRPDARDADRWELQIVDVGPDHAAAFTIQR